MERSVEIAVQQVLIECVNAERERIAEDFVIGCDKDYVDGRVVRSDVMYDEEALEGTAFENVREKIATTTEVLDLVGNDYACSEAMPGLIERYESCGTATEELRKIVLEVMDKKVGW